jgi:uncharacterized protein (TIGR00730 family)
MEVGVTTFSLKKIAVYCGSNMGSDDEFRTAAEGLARTLAEAKLTLLYGGGKVGLMGQIADTMLRQDGKVIGVIPLDLVNKEVAHEGLSELHQVANMHERKSLIAEQADAFILFPGGPGSWEEFFEIITWAKLGYHQKPCGILNVNHYYDHLLKFLQHAVEKQLLHEAHHRMILVDACPRNLLQQFSSYQAPVVSAWM